MTEQGSLVRGKDVLKIFMSHTLNSGVVYHRMVKYADAMKGDKVDVAHSKFDPGQQRTAHWEYELSEDTIEQFNNLLYCCDLAIFQILHSTKALALVDALRDMHKKPILMECDDYFLWVDAEHPARRSYNPGSRQEWVALKQMQSAEGLIVSTPYLKKLYSEYNTNIHVIPNAIDFNIWDNLPEPKPHDEIRIGWQGGANHTGNLRIVKDVIYEIVKEFPEVKCYFWGGVPQFFKHRKGIRSYAKAWAPVDKYPGKIRKFGFDIGIAPLRDNLFTRGKSNLRWLEFSAQKIPTVCSNVESYKHDIKHGKTGFLASDEQEWYKYLVKLIKNEKKRREIGQAAYDDVKKRYNIEKRAKDYIKFCAGIKNGKIKTGNTVSVKKPEKAQENTEYKHAN